MKKIISALLSLSLIASVFTALPAQADGRSVTKEYYDVNFDNSSDNAETWTNTADSGLALAYCSWASEVKFATQLTEDPIKGNNAVQFKIPRKPTGAYYIGTRDNVPEDSFDNVVAWYELSFKMENGIVPIQLEAAGNPFFIDANGAIRLGQNADPVVENATVQPDEWYHLVVAADNINKFGSDTKYHAWLNGELLETSEKTTGCTVTRNSMYSTAMTRFLLYLGQNSKKTVNFYLDNVKMYTTSGAGDVAAYDPQSIYGGAELSSDIWIVDGATLKVAPGATLADVSGAFTTGGGKMSFFDGSSRIADSELDAASAAGKLVYVTSTDGVAYKKYEIVEDSSLSMPDMAKSYCNVDFDSGSDTADSWTNKVAGGIGFGPRDDISGAGFKRTLAADAIRGNNVLAIDVPADGADKCYIGAASVPEKDRFDKYITWYELSFKFEGAPTELAAYAAGAAYGFSKDGTLSVGGSRLDGVTPSVGEWHHLVVAADNLNRTDDTTKIYAWLDGESAADGATAELADTASWDRFLIEIGAGGEKGARLLLDNIKMYKTDGADDVKSFRAGKIYDGTALSSKLWKIGADTVSVAKDITLADVAERLSADGEIVYFDGDERIAPSMLGKTAADGKTVYVRSTGGIGVKKYTIAADASIVIPEDVVGPNEEIETWFYDVDFDQSGDADTNAVNKAAGGPGFSYCSGATSTEAGAVEQKLVYDAIRDSKVWSFDMKKAKQGSLAYAVGQMSIGAKGVDTGTIWYEMSLKFDKSLANIFLLANGYPFEITETGDIYIGGLASNASYPGTKADNVTLKAGEWYHIVIACDNVDKVDGKAKYYAWINGEKVITSETGMSGCAALQGGDLSELTHYLLYMRPRTSGSSGVKIDNHKVYRIAKSVKDTDFDPTAILKGAEASSYELKIDGGDIYIPAGETLSEAISLLNPFRGAISCMKDGAAVADADKTVTEAVGCELYVKSTSGIGIKKYTFKNGLRLFDMNRENALWKKNGADYVSTASELSTDDELTLTVECTNNSDSRKTGVLVLALYNGDMLSGYSFTNISVPVGGTTVTTAPAMVKNTENLSARAYVWNSADDFTPKMMSAVLE